jgi:hypothetical protein
MDGQPSNNSLALMFNFIRLVFLRSTERFLTIVGRPLKAEADMRRCSWLILLGAALASLAAVEVSPATAGEAAYCLKCTNPDQNYICRVTGQSVSKNNFFKLYCIVRTARRGRHESCAMTAGSENCDGVTRSFKYQGPSVSASLVDNPKVKRFISKVEEDYRRTPKMSATTQTGVPTTQTNSNSPRRSILQRFGHAAQNAGAVVGGFAQGSYRCLRSLFRKCRSNGSASPKETISER